jgi:hypothetical protein
MTLEELLAKYIDIGIGQYNAIEAFDDRTFSRLYRHKRAIATELKSRPGDQRPLLDHANLQVRINAANERLALAPEEALATLEVVRATRIQPFSGDAGMALRALKWGYADPS